MAYKSTSILKLVSDVETGKIFLPALQRKFVWDKNQISLLFDSLMKNFPIGTFLFWALKQEIANTYVFYEFLKEYDQRHPYNRRKDGSFLVPEIIGVLDGQQRLSSMYIGLQGTHTEKTPRRRSNDDSAYRRTKLYLNLLSLPYYVDSNNNLCIKEDQNFEFTFLTEQESQTWITRRYKDYSTGEEQSKEEHMFWFKVGDALLWHNDPEFDLEVDKIINKCTNTYQKDIVKQNTRFIKKALGVLHNRISKESVIHYFEIENNDLEDILKIFVRVNSGGTILSKTDLLFSTIVATWENGREEIERLLQKINQKGDGFSFGNEFLMRSCLVLSDASVLFKVNSFQSKTVYRIKKEWDNIARAIDTTVNILAEFGFSSNLLTSQNSVIIIAYYIYKGGIVNDETKFEIKKYLIHALLNGVYGSSQDQLLTILRNSFRIDNGKDDSGIPIYSLKQKAFSFQDLLLIELPSRKTLYVTDKDIESFMSYKKSAASFFVLSLLYPNLKYHEVLFHQDHIHPAAEFNKERLLGFGLSEESLNEWLEKRDMIPNLQLMEGRLNESKSNTDFKQWLSMLPPDEQQQFKITNFIPNNIDLEFANFSNFFEIRKQTLKDKLSKVLSINNNVQLSNEDYLSQTSAVEDENFG